MTAQQAAGADPSTCSPAPTEPSTHEQPAASLLSLPLDVLARLVWMLEPCEPQDRLRLAAACRELLMASRDESPSWWQWLTVDLPSQDAVAGFEAWLARCRPVIWSLVVQAPSADGSTESKGLLGVALPQPPLPHLEQLTLRAFIVSPSQLCAVVAHTQLTSLNLLGCSLGELPPQISQPGQLQSLLLAPPPQALASLQHASGLSSLTHLFLEAEAASEAQPLPGQLSSLSWLRRLTVVNVYTESWDLLSGLSSLTCLVMHACELEAVPQGISCLTALQLLSLHGNGKLHAGWQHLQPLCMLTTLYLSSCGLAALPAAISALTALKVLDVSKWDDQASMPTVVLQEPMDALQQLRHLTALELDVCSQPEVPAAFTALSALRTLDVHFVGEEPVGALSRLTTLRQLTALTLGLCGHAEVPAVLSCLTALEELRLFDWGSPSTLAAAWDRLGGLVQLKHLFIVDGTMGAIPSSFTGLTALRRLSFVCCHHLPTTGWENLVALRSLKELRLDDCALTEVPAGLSVLTALQSLDISRNELSSGFSHLEPLVSLEVLIVSESVEDALPTWVLEREQLTTWLFASKKAEPAEEADDEDVPEEGAEDPVAEEGSSDEEE